MRLPATLVCLFLTCSVVFGQTKVEFEVASIKPSPDIGPNNTAGLHMDGAQIRVSWLSLKDYIGMAYRMKLPQIFGPEWMAAERFDIAAKLPEGTTQAQIPEMLQSLLADRFGMKSHHEQKEFPVYALEVAKSGLKIKETDPAAATEVDPNPGSISVQAGGAGVSMKLGNGAYYQFSDNKFEAKKFTMATFVQSLYRFMDRPVVDKTGLTGVYDLTLEFSPEDYRAMMMRAAVAAGVIIPPQALRMIDEAPGDSLPNALNKLGLTMTSQKALLDVLVVDSIQRRPTTN